MHEEKEIWKEIRGQKEEAMYSTSDTGFTEDLYMVRCRFDFRGVRKGHKKSKSQNIVSEC